MIFVKKCGILLVIYIENEVCEILKLDSKFKKYISNKYYSNE